MTLHVRFKVTPAESLLLTTGVDLMTERRRLGKLGDYAFSNSYTSLNPERATIHSNQQFDAEMEKKFLHAMRKVRGLQATRKA